MASPRHDGSSTPVRLDVHRLEHQSAHGESVVTLKLTDESIAAIQKAQRHKLPLRIRVDAQGGVIELGRPQEGGEVFRFAIQALPAPYADALVNDSKGYTTRASVSKKYTIQATEKTFDETREKAKKLVEEEQKRCAKDVSRGRRDQKPVVTARRDPGVPSSSKLLLKNAPAERLDSPRDNKPSSHATPPARPSMSNSLKNDLLKKKLRQRVVHVVVTARYKSVDDIIKRLRKDGLPPDQDDTKTIEHLINEVSDVSESGRRSLKPSLNNEVDQRWAWFTSEEKSHVRKVLQGTQTTNQSSSFAPVRKSGMAPPQAPSSEATERRNGATVSPPEAPHPPSRVYAAGGAIVGGAKKVSPKLAAPPPSTNIIAAPPITKLAPSPKVETMDDFMSTTQPVKRKAHIPAGAAGAEKRARQESASPPEDPTNHSAPPPPVIQPPPPAPISRVVEKPLPPSLAPLPAPSLSSIPLSSGVTSNGGSSAGRSANSNSSSSRISSPPSSLSSPQPKDWSKDFPEARSLAEAEKYYQSFCDEYPEYMRCFQYLNRIANEFRDLEQSLKSATREKDREKIEKSIQQRYLQYDKDPDFSKNRQRHIDLRAKLDVLKKRIAGWESASASRRPAPLTNSHANIESLFAM